MNYDGRDLCLWGSRDRQTKLLTLQGNALWRTGTFKPTKDSLRFSLGNTQERAALAAGRNLAAAERQRPLYRKNRESARRSAAFIALYGPAIQRPYVIVHGLARAATSATCALALSYKKAAMAGWDSRAVAVGTFCTWPMKGSTFAAKPGRTSS